MDASRAFGAREHQRLCAIHHAARVRGHAAYALEPRAGGAEFYRASAIRGRVALGGAGGIERTARAGRCRVSRAAKHYTIVPLIFNGCALGLSFRDTQPTRAAGFAELVTSIGARCLSPFDMTSSAQQSEKSRFGFRVTHKTHRTIPYA